MPRWCTSTASRVYHIEDADAVDVAPDHPPPADRHQNEAGSDGWLGDARVIGITAGASTPNNKVGETIARICAVAGVEMRLPEERTDGQ